MSLISIVHDFAVLYSTRVHQKEKRWSDGRLRFYEFNNKLEIVSEEQALVIVDFYPKNSKQPMEAGVFSDGNTYTLPNGKMVVEFSEYLGCTERDVSKAFSRSSKPHIKREECSPESLVTSKCVKPVVVKQEKTESANVKRVRSVGLAKPKRPTKQLELTDFMKPIALTIEQRLHRMCQPIRTPRIYPGSNKLTKKLNMELGINTNGIALSSTPGNSNTNHDIMISAKSAEIKEEKDYY